MDVIADDMETDRRRFALIRLAEEIPAEYRIDLVNMEYNAMKNAGRL